MDACRIRERFASTPEVIPQILDRFQAQIETLRRLLTADIPEGDLASLTSQLHKLKGASGYVAAEELTALATRLEAAGKTGDFETLRAGLAQLTSEIDRCLGCLPGVRQDMTITV